MKSTRGDRLVTKKPIATGMPSIIRPTPRPNRISAATQYQAIRLASMPGERPRKFSRRTRKRTNSIAIMRKESGMKPTTIQRGMSNERTSFSFCR